MGKKELKVMDPEIDRRTFLSKLGWFGLAISGVIAGAGNLLYLKPAVTYGPASTFRVGKPEDYLEGIKLTYENERVAVIREKSGFAAISITCTHLGCTVRTSDAGFECPCHGSQYDEIGFVTGGPAPTPLDWYQITVAPNGELEVDKTVKLKPGSYYQV